jgi:hypothetical protein
MKPLGCIFFLALLALRTVPRFLNLQPFLFLPAPENMDSGSVASGHGGLSAQAAAAGASQQSPSFHEAFKSLHCRWKHVTRNVLKPRSRTSSKRPREDGSVHISNAQGPDGEGFQGARASRGGQGSLHASSSGDGQGCTACVYFAAPETLSYASIDKKARFHNTDPEKRKRLLKAYETIQGSGTIVETLYFSIQDGKDASQHLVFVPNGNTREGGGGTTPAQQTTATDSNGVHLPEWLNEEESQLMKEALLTHTLNTYRTHLLLPVGALEHAFVIGKQGATQKNMDNALGQGTLSPPSISSSVLGRRCQENAENRVGAGLGPCPNKQGANAIVGPDKRSGKRRKICHRDISFERSSIPASVGFGMGCSLDGAGDPFSSSKIAACESEVDASADEGCMSWTVIREEPIETDALGRVVNAGGMKLIHCSSENSRRVVMMPALPGGGRDSQVQRMSTLTSLVEEGIPGIILPLKNFGFTQSDIPHFLAGTEIRSIIVDTTDPKKHVPIMDAIIPSRQFVSPPALNNLNGSAVLQQCGLGHLRDRTFNFRDEPTTNEVQGRGFSMNTVYGTSVIEVLHGPAVCRFQVS